MIEYLQVQQLRWLILFTKLSGLCQFLTTSSLPHENIIFNTAFMSLLHRAEIQLRFAITGERMSWTGTNAVTPHDAEGAANPGSMFLCTIWKWAPYTIFNQHSCARISPDCDDVDNGCWPYWGPSIFHKSCSITTSYKLLLQSGPSEEGSCDRQRSPYHPSAFYLINGVAKGRGK